MASCLQLCPDYLSELRLIIHDEDGCHLFFPLDQHLRDFHLCSAERRKKGVDHLGIKIGP